MLKNAGAKIFFVVLFAAISLIAGQINFSRLVGQENQFFTFFQFFGPVAGSFLGPFVGAFSVLLAQIASSIFLGKEFSLINILRLLPMVFAAVYFGLFMQKKHLQKQFSDISIIVPLLAIAAFVLHPVGRAAWFYSLFWLIPIIAKFFSNRLFFRSLGATFAAHAVGGAIWVWTVPMTAEQWIALIPVVAYERLLFAAGISLSFIAFNNLLHWLETSWGTGAVSIEANYLLGKKVLQ